MASVDNDDLIDPTFTALPYRKLADAALSRARDLGVTHADFRFERVRYQHFSVRDGRLQGAEDVEKDVRERQAEGRADRGEELGGRLLAAALDLGEVTEGDARGGGHVTQRAALAQPQPPQRCPECIAPQRHHHACAPSLRVRTKPTPKPRDSPPPT